MKKFILLFLLLLIAFAGFTYRNFFEGEKLRISNRENREKWKWACPNVTQLHSGDLIFRHGRGFISNALMSFGQREKKYSHAGLVSIEEGNVYVYHAIGGEQNATNKLRRDRLEDFCNPSEVHAFGIYRLDLTLNETAALVSSAQQSYRSGLEFDTKFDLSTDDKMYCTEFIYKTVVHALGQRNYLSLSAIAGKNYIACDDLYCNSHCKNIYSYSY